MSDSFYTEIRDSVAEPLLLQFGKSIILNKKIDSVFDPVTGTTTDGTIDNYSGVGIQIDFTLENQGNALTSTGTLIETNDIMLICYFDDKTIVPDINDEIIVNGITYKIVSPVSKQPGNITLLYRLLLRK